MEAGTTLHCCVVYRRAFAKSFFATDTSVPAAVVISRATTSPRCGPPRPECHIYEAPKWLALFASDLMADGTDEESAYTRRMDEWVAWEGRRTIPREGDG